MTDDIDHEKLNAFIDNQLVDNERKEINYALTQDKELLRLLGELHRNDELLATAYNHIPAAPFDPYQALTYKQSFWRQALVASIVFIVSLIAGWQLHTSLNQDVPDIRISDISELPDTLITENKVLVHISVMNLESISNALSQVRMLLENNRNTNLQIEVVANAEGLALLRKGSPFSGDVKELTSRHKNLSFKACGIAMQVAKLREGKEVELLPEAEKIPAALDEILLRLKDGWSYYKS